MLTSALFFGQSSSNSGTNTNRPQPDAMLAQCALAMGTPQQPFNLVAEGQTQRADSQDSVPIRLESRDLTSLRAETGSGDEEQLSVVNKGRGAHRVQGKWAHMPHHTAAYFTPDHLPALMCAPNTRNGIEINDAGDDMVGGRPVFHLKLSARPRGKNAQVDALEAVISEYHLFLDQQSFVVLKSAKYVFSPEAVANRSLWETVYSDYRKVNGVMTPFRMEHFVSGQKFSETVFTNMTAGAALPDSDFQEN
jgi:hypothetical protein